MDEIDKLHADEDRRARLRAAVRARLVEIETEIPSLIAEAGEIDVSDSCKEYYPGNYQKNLNRLSDVESRRDSLVAEHAVLEGLLDRPVARWMPRAGFLIACASLAWQVIAALWRLK